MFLCINRNAEAPNRVYTTAANKKITITKPLNKRRKEKNKDGKIEDYFCNFSSFHGFRLVSPFFLNGKLTWRPYCLFFKVCYFFKSDIYLIFPRKEWLALLLLVVFFDTYFFCSDISWTDRRRLWRWYCRWKRWR